MISLPFNKCVIISPEVHLSESKMGLDAHVYVCTACFEKYVTFVVAHPLSLKIEDLPHNIIKSRPVPENITEPCEHCNECLATRII